MSKKNKNLHKAKKAKNDEFYTQLTDIEKELVYYTEHFKDKIIFCNCDDPEESNFFRYFALNFEKLRLKKLISTHYEEDKPTYKLEITKGLDVNGDGKIDLRDVIKTPLKQNGDFRSPECIDILKKADIIVTNPPFSLFREYITQLIEYDKKFIIIGNENNAVNDKDIFEKVYLGKVWLGNTRPKKFLRPDGEFQTFGNTCWFTNFNHKKRHEELICYKQYKENKELYSFFDNTDIININSYKQIPIDYQGVMGVPITFLARLNPDQFEIIGATNNNHKHGIHFTSYLNGKKTYARLLIKRKE